jgi:N-acetylglucosamine malate deacetylase 1
MVRCLRRMDAIQSYSGFGYFETRVVDKNPCYCDRAGSIPCFRNSQLYCTLAKLDDANPPHKPGAFLFYALHQLGQPSFVVDTSEVFPAKLELLRTHRSQFAKTAEEFGVIAHGVSDYLFGLESRDRYFGSLIGARFGEALVADRPMRLAGMSDILALLSGSANAT